MSVATFNRLGGGLVPLEPLVERLRMVKDDDELELVRTACAITDQAFADISRNIGPAVTERDIARAARRPDDRARRRQARLRDHRREPARTAPSRTTRPTDRELRSGDLVTMDFGALYQGYHADMTRTVCLGAARGLAAGDLRPGRRGAAGGLQAGPAGRAGPAGGRGPASIIMAAGHGDRFRHGLGHGVGPGDPRGPVPGPVPYR